MTSSLACLLSSVLLFWMVKSEVAHRGMTHNTYGMPSQLGTLSQWPLVHQVLAPSAVPWQAVQFLRASRCGALVAMRAWQGRIAV